MNSSYCCCWRKRELPSVYGKPNSSLALRRIHLSMKHLYFLPQTFSWMLYAILLQANRREKDLEVLHVDNWHWWSQRQRRWGIFSPKFNNLGIVSIGHICMRLWDVFCEGIFSNGDIWLVFTVILRYRFASQPFVNWVCPVPTMPALCLATTGGQQCPKLESHGELSPKASPGVNKILNIRVIIGFSFSFMGHAKCNIHIPQSLLWNVSHSWPPLSTHLYFSLHFRISSNIPWNTFPLFSICPIQNILKSAALSLSMKQPQIHVLLILLPLACWLLIALTLGEKSLWKLLPVLEYALLSIFLYWD